MQQGKEAVKSLLARAGYAIVRTRWAPPAYETEGDAEEARALLETIVPVVADDHETWLTPAFLEDYFRAERLAMVRLLLDACDEAGVAIAGQRILDVGCHAGCLLRLALARYEGVRAAGCDINDVKLAMARVSAPDADIFFSSFSDLPADRKADVVFMTEVLEHLVDPAAAVTKLLEHVAPGGTLVLTVPDGREDTFPAKEFNAEFQSYAGHVNFWSPESWIYFLERTVPRSSVRTDKLASGHLFAAVSAPRQRA